MEAWYAELDALTEKHPSNLCLKHLAGEGKGYYDGLSDDLKARFAKCVASGLENADSSVGVYAMMPKDYEELAQYFDKVRPCPRAAPPRPCGGATSLGCSFPPPPCSSVSFGAGDGRAGLGQHTAFGRTGLFGGRPATRAQGPPVGARPLPEERRKAPPGGRTGHLKRGTKEGRGLSAPGEGGDSLAPARSAGDATLGAPLAHGGVPLDGARRLRADAEVN